jgi:acyl CoA:acetate/3-ketoacid CoA transferase beta subunit
VSLSFEERADLLAVLLGREINDESVVVMGTGTPLTAVAVLFALASHAPGASYTTPLAGGLSVAPHQLTLGSLERAAYDHALLRSAQIIDLWELATINPRTADRWLQFFRPAQMDRMGNMNNSRVRRPDGSWLQLPGSVGISDMAAYYPRLFAYITRHDARTFPEHVDFVSAPGTLGTVEDRRRRGLRWGRPFRVYTDLAVLEFDDAGLMVLRSIHPGVSADEVRAATGFAVETDGVGTTDLPTEAELTALRSVDPEGLRRLEFLPARERRAVVVAALTREGRL